MKDLPDVVKSTKIYKKIQSSLDTMSQLDLDCLAAWSQNSRLTFNKDKCKSQTVTRKGKSVKSLYILKGKSLEQVDSEHDLGIIVSKDLTWNIQALEQTSKANELLGYIQRNTRFIHSISTRKT